ncbi:MAG: hypothetical protein AWU57_286 [Marinobacter sp. T13-3]|nr:MAG: hypothetical protein AWU57_286 [Marinobacter sp. T13-3]
MEIVFTIHNPNITPKPRKVRRTGEDARRIIQHIEKTIRGSAKPWIGRYNPTMDITIHHLFD